MAAKPSITPAIDGTTALLQLRTPEVDEALVSGVNIQCSAGDLAEAKIDDVKSTIDANVRKTKRELKTAQTVLEKANKAYTDLVNQITLPADFQSAAAQVVAALQTLWPSAELRLAHKKAPVFDVTVNAQTYDVTLTIDVPKGEGARYGTESLQPRRTFPFSPALGAAHKAVLDAQQGVGVCEATLLRMNKNLASLPALTKRFTSVIVKEQMNKSDASKAMMAALNKVQSTIEKSMNLDTAPELLALPEVTE